MEYVQGVLTLILLIALWMLFSYVKKIPDQIHQLHLKSYEHDLNKQLETFKNDLSREIEMLKITESQLHIYKAKEFTEFTEFFFKKMMNKDFISKLNTPRILQELNDTLMKFSSHLFFFASDETVKKFVEFRRRSIEGSSEGLQLVVLMAELIVLMRKDLGYRDTECGVDDFLYLMLKDWNEEKSQQYSQAFSG